MANTHPIPSKTKCNLSRISAVAYPKLLSTISRTLLVPLFFQSGLAHSDDQRQNPFEFIKHLQGCHKGDNVKGLWELKQYFEKFGYLNYNQFNLPVHANDDDFDELLESAVKTYQLNYHLNDRELRFPNSGYDDDASVRHGGHRQRHLSYSVRQERDPPRLE